MSVVIRVEGYTPPKKDGANSMWGQANVRPLLKALDVSAAQRAVAQRGGDGRPVVLV